MGWDWDGMDLRVGGGIGIIIHLYKSNQFVTLLESLTSPPLHQMVLYE